MMSPPPRTAAPPRFPVRLRTIALAIGALALLLIGSAAYTQIARAAPTVSTTSGAGLTTIKLYYSKNAPSSYNNQYVGVRVQNDSTPRTDLWVKITNLSGGNVTLATGETGERHVGAVAANASTTVYFLFHATAATTTDTTFNIALYNGPPSAGGTQIGTATSAAFTEVGESQNASANKVTGGYVSPSNPSLGSEFQVVLTGLTGQMSNASGTAVFTPAFAQGWDPSAFELVRTELQFDFNSAGNQNFVNTLYFPISNNGSTAGSIDNNGGPYTATYTFRAVNRTSASVTPSPVGHIKSGSIWKYTNASSLSSIAPVEPVTNSFIITAGASPTRSADGLITYILTLANTSTKTLSVDLVTDVLPAGTTYVAGSSTYQGTSIADPNNASDNLTWSGPFTVTGGARATLTYQIQATSVTSTPTDYTNSATGRVGATVIDTTLDTTDTAPATATASVSNTYAPDTTAPTITLSAVDGASAALADGGSTGSTAATMTFSASETATFTCSLDGAAPTSCTSPTSYSSLATGSHTFWVYATDDAGNIGSRSLQWEVVNNAKPEVASFEPKAAASNTSPLTFTLQLTKDITAGSLTTSDLTLVTTGSPGTWTIASVLGSGSTYLVSVTSSSPGTSGTVAVRLAADSVSDGARTGPTSAATSGAVTMTNTLGLAITSASPANGATSTSTSATFSFGPAAGFYPPDRYMCKGPGEASYTECTSPITYTGLSDGAKTFYVYGDALDASDNVVSTTSASPESSSWTIDASAPSDTITTPTAGAALTDNTPTLAGACTAGDGTVSIPVYSGATASGTPVQTLSASCSGGAWTVDAATLPDGQYTAKAQQTDAAGNIGYSAARTFTIDATVPTVTVTPDAASTSTASADFTITFSESVTGLTSGDLTIGGTSASPAWSVNTITGSGASYSVNLTAASTPAQGTLTLAVTANAVTDAAGNTGPASNSAAASMDVVSLGDLVDGSVTANNGNAWGAARSLPLTKTNFSVSGGGSATNNLYRLAAPWSGGACGSFDAGTEIDLGTTSDDTSALGDKCFKYELRGNGNSRSATAVSEVVKVDLTAPVLGSLAIAGGDNQLTNSAAPGITKGAKSDAASGLKSSDEKLTRAGVSFTGNACGSFAAYDPDAETDVPLASGADSGLASGCYRYTHRVGDNAGNQTTSQSTVKVDVDDPTGGTMTVNGGNAWTNSQNPSLGGTTYSDVNSGIASGAASITRERATLDGANCASDWATDTTTVDDSGGAENASLVQSCYRYTRLATDRAGNSSSTGPVTVKIDRTNPTGGSITAASGSEWTRDSTPALSGNSYTDANSGVATSSLTRARGTLSGSTCGAFGSESAVTVSSGVDSDSLTQACYRYTRAATDTAGNGTQVTTTVKIDQTDPTGGGVTANGGDATWTKDAKPSLTRTAFGDANSGLDAATDAFTRGFAAFNGSGNCTGVSYSGTTSVTIDGDGRDADSGTLAEGCYRYRSSASDNVGNTSTHNATVFIDRTDPAGGTITAGKTSGTWANTPKPGLSGTAFTDANSGINGSTSVTRIVRERAEYVSGGDTCSGTWTVDDANVAISGGQDSDALTEACYRYTREAADNAGNSAATSPDTVKLDLTAPVGGAVTINGGTDVDLEAGDAASFDVNDFSDRLSGLRSGSETLTRRIAPWLGSVASVQTRSGRIATRSEFGDYGSAQPVTLIGAEDPVAVDPGRYFYEHTVIDVSGNVSTRTALVEIRPRGGVPPAVPVDTPPAGGAPSTPGSSQEASEAPRMTASIVVTRRRVRSGRVLPAAIVITNTGGSSGPVIVSVRLRAGISVAEMPHGGRLADGRLIVPLDGLAAGKSVQVKVFLRISSARTRTLLVRGAVHRAGAADVPAISPKITVLAQTRRNGLTG